MYEEANRKLLEWAGFRLQTLEELKPQYRHEANLSWVYPTGEINHQAPNFFHPELGLSLQFKYLVPILQKRGICVTVGAFECSGYYACCYETFNPEPEQTRSEISAAVALGMAIVKWLESEKE